MSERISDTNNGTANSEARTPRFNRSKTVQVIISILVALALWVYVDVEKAPERTKTTLSSGLTGRAPARAAATGRVPEGSTVSLALSMSRRMAWRMWASSTAHRSSTRAWIIWKLSGLAWSVRVPSAMVSTFSRATGSPAARLLP